MKEAAILMLADAAESAVRAMREPTAGRIETQVHAIVTKRLTDGQLDDCEMTLKEVHAIETSLVKSLSGIYHGRVPYPSQKKPANGNGNDAKSHDNDRIDDADADDEQ
jgi:membrane-associated HD superfamily phosphohydrolase